MHRIVFPILWLSLLSGCCFIADKIAEVVAEDIGRAVGEMLSQAMETDDPVGVRHRIQGRDRRSRGASAGSAQRALSAPMEAAPADPPHLALVARIKKPSRARTASNGA